MTSTARDLALCPRCGTRAETHDRFCGGCGASRTSQTLAAGSTNLDAPTGPIDIAVVTAPLAIPRPTRSPEEPSASGSSSTDTAQGSPRADEKPAATTSTSSSSPSGLAEPAHVSARGEVVAVAREAMGEWKAMSGGEKAGTVAISLFNGIAGLWNAALGLAVVAGVIIVLYTACSGGSLGISASTTCDTYLKTDQDARYAAAQDLGRKAHGSTFKGPMAGLNLDYSCSEASGSRTIGSIMGISS